MIFYSAFGDIYNTNEEFTVIPRGGGVIPRDGGVIPRGGGVINTNVKPKTIPSKKNPRAALLAPNKNNNLSKTDEMTLRYGTTADIIKFIDTRFVYFTPWNPNENTVLIRYIPLKFYDQPNIFDKFTLSQLKILYNERKDLPQRHKDYIKNTYNITFS